MRCSPMSRSILRIPQSVAELAAATNVALVCPPDEARRRVRRMEQLGFDEILLVSHYGALEELEEVRSWVA
jgi:hypothetical protein